MASEKLYVWARRMNFIQRKGKTILSPDHTWVTDYPSPGPLGFAKPIPEGNHYWFCWGVFHSGADGNQNPKPCKPYRSPIDADIAEATCICEANVQKDSSNPPWPHARIPGIYGEHGVCHQVANRILWSAGLKNGKRVTVEGVRGWELSWFVYGPYGSIGPWPLPECSPDIVAPYSPVSTGIATLAKKVRKAVKKSLDPGKKKALQELQVSMLKRKETLARKVPRGIDEIGFADQINALLAETLQEARHSILNRREFRAMFGFDLEAAAPQIADPAMAQEYMVPRVAVAGA